VEQICELVEQQSQAVSNEKKQRLQEKTGRFQHVYERLIAGSRPPIPVDSDDE
jgi:hypothetical protein